MVTLDQISAPASAYTWKQRIPALWGQFVACQGLLLLPVWLDPTLSYFGRTAVFGGWLIGLELSAMAVMAAAVATRIDRIDRRLIGACGLILILTGNLLSLVAFGGEQLAAFQVARILSGVGAGMLFAVLTALASSRETAQEFHPLAHAPFFVLASAIYLLSPLFLDAFGAAGLFSWMLTNAALGFLMVFELPRGAYGYRSAQSLPRHPALSRPALAHVLAAASFVGAWSFLCLTARSVYGFAPGSIAMLLAIGILLGFFARPAARLFEGRTAPVTGLILSIAVFIALLGAVTLFRKDPLIFVLWIVASPFVMIVYLEQGRQLQRDRGQVNNGFSLPLYCYYFLGGAAGVVVMGAAWQEISSMSDLIGASLLWGALSMALLLTCSARPVGKAASPEAKAHFSSRGV